MNEPRAVRTSSSSAEERRPKMGVELVEGNGELAFFVGEVGFEQRGQCVAFELGRRGRELAQGIDDQLVVAAELCHDGLQRGELGLEQRERAGLFAGVVAGERSGREVMYRLVDHHLADIVVAAVTHAAEGGE